MVLITGCALAFVVGLDEALGFKVKVNFGSLLRVTCLLILVGVLSTILRLSGKLLLKYFDCLPYLRLMGILDIRASVGVGKRWLS